MVNVNLTYFIICTKVKVFGDELNANCQSLGYWSFYWFYTYSFMPRPIMGQKAMWVNNCKSLVNWVIKATAIVQKIKEAKETVATAPITLLGCPESKFWSNFFWLYNNKIIALKCIIMVTCFYFLSSSHWPSMWRMFFADLKSDRPWKQRITHWMKNRYKSS